MTTPLAVINIVGLSRSLLGDHSPHINALIHRHAMNVVTPPLPAVTCTAQSAMLTGRHPREHGVVGNGWYHREQAQVQFWKQSNAIVEGPKIWDAARAHDPTITTANMFWWFNMYSTTDISVTPRPQYRADGRKVPDIYSHPAELRDELQDELGQFPLFHFWGPASSVVSSRWIADASMHVHRTSSPTLTLIYLPHLDYGLQKLGPTHPDIPKHVAEIDAIVGDLVAYFDNAGVETIALSEYGIEPVTDAVHINRHLREAGWLSVRTENGRELLDAGASAAFAVADHQIAHVYVNDPEDIHAVSTQLASIDGIDEVLTRAAMTDRHIDHARAGEIVALSDSDRWFSYNYWLDDRKAPDFARTVDIHNKPGYDPVELFLDPAIRFPKLTIASKLLRKKLGFRTLMDVIPLDTALVRGSHGRDRVADDYKPVYIGPDAPDDSAMQSTDVHDIILNLLLR